MANLKVLTTFNGQYEYDRTIEGTITSNYVSYGVSDPFLKKRHHQISVGAKSLWHKDKLPIGTPVITYWKGGEFITAKVMNPEGYLCNYSILQGKHHLLPYFKELSNKLEMNIFESRKKVVELCDISTERILHSGEAKAFTVLNGELIRVKPELPSKGFTEEELRNKAATVIAVFDPTTGWQCYNTANNPYR